MALNKKALEIAISQLGVEEVPRGSNKGPQVSAYLRSVGITVPASWCMAFVYWCHNEAAKQLNEANTMERTGGVLYQWRQRRAKYAVKDPQPGDVFIMDYGKGLGHTGIVELVEVRNGKTILHTIEGNTNDEGSREGYEVCRRERLPAKIAGYLRF